MKHLENMKLSDSPVSRYFTSCGIGVMESHHSRQFEMKPESHDYGEIMYVLGGRGAVTFGNMSHPLDKGDVLVIPSGHTHCFQDEKSTPLALMILCIQDRILQSAPDPMSLTQPRHFRNKSLSHLAHRTLRRLLFEQAIERPFYSTAMVGAVLRLLCDIKRCEAAPTPLPSPRKQTIGRIEQIVSQYISTLEHTFFEDENLEQVTSRLGLSRRTFTGIFRKLTGRSWLNHVRLLRLAHAKKLLRTPDRTVLSAAFESGFNDLSSFYRVFRQFEKTTPDLWRGKRR